MNIKIATIIAIVVIAALWLTKNVDFNLNKSGISLLADKNHDKDTVKVKKVQKSEVDVKNRQGQDVSIEDVTDSSKVKIQ